MNEMSAATEAGDEAALALARKKVDLFTQQLNESNPILTDISDAMTLQGDLMERVAVAPTEAERKELNAQVVECEAKKEGGNARLKECSAKYNDAMKRLREGR
jgi:hypothetical protein